MLIIQTDFLCMVGIITVGVSSSLSYYNTCSMCVEVLFSHPGLRPVQRLGGRGCNKFVPVMAGDGTKIAPTGDIFDQPPGGMISIRGKLHVVLSPDGAVLVTSPGMELSYPRPPRSLNNS